jgi:hypothetical protein
MSYVIGDRVWWHHTDSTIRYGAIAVLEDRPGVQPDGDPDILYLEQHQLHRDTTGNVPERDGIYSRIPDTVYHADLKSLSVSGARILTTLTPAEYFENLHTPPDPKPQYDFGHLAHKMVLGEGAQIVRVDARDWRTTAAKEAREKAWAHGKIPALPPLIDTAQRMAGKVFAHRIAAKLLENGAAELSGYWHDEPTGVRLRFRPDFLPETGSGRPIIVDYKSAASANPRRFAKAAYDYGYYQQAGWYIDGLQHTTGAADAAFVFVVQQKDPPFLVSVCQLEPEDIELGRRQNRAAIDLYARCRDTGKWPGYDDMSICGLPGWARKQIHDDLGETA